MRTYQDLLAVGENDRDRAGFLLGAVAQFQSEALYKYHTVLAAAAISQVPVYTCVVLNEVGRVIAIDSYNKADGQVE